MKETITGFFWLIVFMTIVFWFDVTRVIGAATWRKES
jgi:hypothetical protein